MVPVANVNALVVYCLRRRVTASALTIRRMAVIVTVMIVSAEPAVRVSVLAANGLVRRVMAR